MMIAAWASNGAIGRVLDNLDREEPAALERPFRLFAIPRICFGRDLLPRACGANEDEPQLCRINKIAFPRLSHQSRDQNR